MNLPISIRRAEKTDVGSMADIAYRAWETGILPLLTERSGMRQAEQKRLTTAVSEMIGQIIVADVDDLVVGWCSRMRGRAYIPFLFVTPGLQSQGIGSALLTRMETMLELEGATRVQLDTPADHVRAVRFYERQGYRILAMRPDGRAGHEPFMSVRLEKQLHPYTGQVTDID